MPGFRLRAGVGTPRDETPDAFTINAKVDQVTSTAIRSDPFTPTGYAGRALVTVTGGMVSREGGADSAGPLYINAGDTLTCVLTSSEEFLTEATATVTVNGVSAVYSVTTQVIPGAETVSLARSGGVQLASLLSSVPSGNNVELVNVTGTGTLSIGATPIYRDGDELLGPGSGWGSTGAGDSGYASWTEDVDGTPTARTAVPAADTRTTASPILRLATPWARRIDGDLTLCFEAYAKGGIDMVRVYCEGAYVDLTTKQNYHYTDVNGVQRVLKDVYCVTLDHSAFIAAHASSNTINLFARAYPTDTGMQTRLLGRTLTGVDEFSIRNCIRFFPESTTHTKTIYVDTTQAATTSGLPGGVDARVQSVQDAIALCGNRTVSGISFGSTQLGRIIVQNTHTWSPSDTHDYGGSGFSKGGGFHTIECATGVTLTIGRTSYVANNSGWSQWVGGIEFKGSGVVFDQTYDRNLMRIASSNIATGGKVLTFIGYWLNGCTVTAQNNLRTSLGARKDMWDGDIVPEYGLFFITDAHINYRPAGQATMAVNSEFNDYWIDMFNSTRLVVGCVVRRLSEGEDGAWPGHSTDHPALTISYSGAKAYAGIRRAGNTGTYTDTHTLTLETSDDGTTYSSTSGNGASYSLATYWDAGLLVAAINADTATHGFSAVQDSTPDDGITDRNMRSLTKVTWSGGAFIYWAGQWNGDASRVVLRSAGVDVTTIGSTPARAPGALVTYQDVHADFFQNNSGSAGQNILIKNTCSNGSNGAQLVNFSNGSGVLAADWCMVNVSHDASGVFFYIALVGTYEHLLLLHTIAPCNWDLQAPAVNYDEYSVIANCAMETFSRDDTTGAVIDIINNHCNLNTLGAFPNTGTQSGASVETLFPLVYDDASPEPSAAVNATRLATPYAAAGRDISGFDRAATSPRGPKEFVLESATFTYAEAQDLAINSVNEIEGSDVNLFHLRYKDGAGNTGNDVELYITVDVAD